MNSRTRIAFETELASNLKKLPHDSTLLMYLGDHVGALQRAGIPLRRTINEGNHRPWKAPIDREGLWERALANPSQYVDYVVAMRRRSGGPQRTKGELSSIAGDPYLRTACRPQSIGRTAAPGNHAALTSSASQRRGACSFPVIKSSQLRAYAQLQHIYDVLQNEMTSVVGISLARLVLATILGGLIGLERQLKHRPAGLRTNLFICLGAAMFTLLSDELAVEHIGDHTRIAAQIIPGIGFIGAGSILHARDKLVTGLTTAATIFVVASVGMAVGGGLYLTSIFATGLILLCLFLLGRAEERFGLKAAVHAYEVAGRSADEMTA